MKTPGPHEGGPGRQQPGSCPENSKAQIDILADDDLPTTPVVPIIKVVPTRHTRLIAIRCPHCGKTHTHGWPFEVGDRAPGDRLAHCHRGSYFILAPTGGAR